MTIREKAKEYLEANQGNYTAILITGLVDEIERIESDIRSCRIELAHIKEEMIRRRNKI